MTSNYFDRSLLQQWVGKTEVLHDVVRPDAVAALAATLDYPDAPAQGEALPPLWHWIFFHAVAQQSQLGEDGHPKRGGFLPPVPLPRRMWAGGRFTFHAPARIGEAVARTSTIRSVQDKEGASGRLVFVTVQHDIAQGGAPVITEEHDIVYRDLPAPDAAAPAARTAPTDAHWSRTIHPDPVLLFRYSALTFNGHRIHYDRSYVTGVEGYPGLIVHGPLIATLLIDLVRRALPDADIARFSFRAVAPLFDTASFAVCGKPGADGKTIDLWAQNERGELAMQAEATLR
ncbi:3-methylfumaryl-CoA hydratase [Massilia sp. UYP11]|uniref:FAS1-like dehydratase domain-containing protein n=1 Tax=Massilia sp. UYP11 TaxID=1756385 RepID=UPI003D22D859